jgi:NAD(P)-dependent dehydrogenase (short-subunit alcohol dehydrogenase family)
MTTLLGRFGTAQEAAASVLFLMTDNYVTGQIITVDGGEPLTWLRPHRLSST